MPMILFKKYKDLFKNISIIYGESTIQKLYKQGRGVMILGPHIGCYEIGPMYYSKKYPCAMLYTPPKIEVFDRIIYKTRSQLCSKMSPASYKGVKILFKSLIKKEITAMLTDQIPKNKGTYINFFQVPVKVMNFPGRLYSKLKPATVISYSIRNHKEPSYTLYIENMELMVIKIKNGVRIKDKISHVINNRYEEIVRRFPHQYQWSYKRFKYHPDGINFY